MTASDLINRARTISRRLRNPPGGIKSTELDIVPEHIWRRRQTKQITRAVPRADDPWKDYIARCCATPIPSPRRRSSEEILPAGHHAVSLSIREIVDTVSKYYGVSVPDIISRRRTANVIRPRHVAMYLSRELTIKSFPEIGRAMAKRDHTTVLHAWAVTKTRMESDPELASEVSTLRAELCGDGRS